jgi:hypothetical protein
MMSVLVVGCRGDQMTRVCCGWGGVRLREGTGDLGLLCLLLRVLVHVVIWCRDSLHIGLKFQICQSRLRYAVVSSPRLRSRNCLRTQRQPHDQQTLMFAFSSRSAGPSAASNIQTTSCWPGICSTAHHQTVHSACLTA